jgi:prepilin-type N-terminal cleavage/methylation domain-containing protein
MFKFCKQQGFTLVEVLVAFTILGLLTASMWPAFNNQQKVNRDMELRTAAIQAAQLTLDNLRFEDPSTMINDGEIQTTNVVIGDKSFTVVSQFCADTTYCTSNNIRFIEVKVSYLNDQIYEVSTVYTKLR